MLGLSWEFLALLLVSLLDGLSGLLPWLLVRDPLLDLLLLLDPSRVTPSLTLLDLDLDSSDLESLSSVAPDLVSPALLIDVLVFSVLVLSSLSLSPLVAVATSEASVSLSLSVTVLLTVILATASFLSNVVGRETVERPSSLSRSKFKYTMEPGVPRDRLVSIESTDISLGGGLCEARGLDLAVDSDLNVLAGVMSTDAGLD